MTVESFFRNELGRRLLGDSRTEIRWNIPKLHPSQQEVAGLLKRFNVLCCGRRWGKTFFEIGWLLDAAGAGHPVAWFAPSYKFLTEAWRDMLRAAEGHISRANFGEKRIELTTGGVIEMWTLEDPNAGRSRKYKRAVIDEAAISPNLEEAWLAAIRPTLADLRGEGMFGSTPKGLNYFFDLFNLGADPANEDWMACTSPTSTNPYIHPDEIEDARRLLPEDTFAQEYRAQFIQHAGAVFRNVDACVVALPTQPEAHRGHMTMLGADWAQAHDFTAISVVCANCSREVELDRFQSLDWATQRSRVAEIIRRWNVVDALIERNSIGGPNLEALAEEDLPVRGFDTTAASKGPMIRSLALAFERGEFLWLADPVGRNELLSYEIKIDPFTGRPRYSAPPGKHDDTVIARGLAFKAAFEGGPAIDVRAAAELAGYAGGLSAVDNGW